MRPVFVLASITGVLALGYAFSPDFSDSARPSKVTPTSPAESPRVAAPPPRPAMAAVTPARPGPTSTKLNPKLKSSAAAPRTAASKGKSGETRHGSPKPQNAGLADASNLTPSTEKQSRPAALPAHPMSIAQAQASASQNPADQRWIKELSGQNARVSMNRSRVGADGACQIIENGECVRVPPPKDLSLVGVLVKTKRLAETPTAPLDGKVVRGNFTNYTPGVYLK